MRLFGVSSKAEAGHNTHLITSQPIANGRWCGPFGRAVLLRRCGDLGRAEGGDHLLCEAVEVCELNLERGAERRRANDAVEAGIALLDRLQLLDDVLRPADIIEQLKAVEK